MESKAKSMTSKALFTREQANALRKVFPARVLNDTTSEAKLRDYMGEQKVVQYVVDHSV